MSEVDLCRVTAELLFLLRRIQELMPGLASRVVSLQQRASRRALHTRAHHAFPDGGTLRISTADPSDWHMAAQNGPQNVQGAVRKTLWRELVAEVGFYLDR